MTARDESQALIPALNQFQDAIAALIKPKHEIIDQHILQIDSLYQQLRDSLAGRQGYTRDRTARSLPTLWLDAHDCLTCIDTVVAAWRPPQGAQGHKTARGGRTIRPGTIKRLEALSEPKQWRPQDSQILTDRASQLESFAKTIKNLLQPEIVIYLRGHRCPLCNKSHFRKRDFGGDEVTSPTLMIRGEQALCQSCRAVWEPERFALLGRELGMQPSPI